jgi:amidase
MSDAAHNSTDGFLTLLDLAPTGSGPLGGLNFAAKDLIDIAGTVTGCGNPTWAATHPPALVHAPVFEILLQAGARCLGKTITDEFAFSLVGENHFYGTPRNPKAPSRVPGGSSSGSASVVAAGEVDFALGTDTAGSIRVPAANCGIYGLRTTWGGISLAGIQPLAPSFDTVGIFALRPEILGRVIQVLSPSEAPPRINRVLMLEDAWQLADKDVAACRNEAARRLSAAGIESQSITLGELVPGDLGADFFAWKTTFSAVQWPEVWSTYGAWLETVKPGLGPKIAENFANVKKASRDGLAAGLKNRLHARHALRAFLAPDTALCLPTAPSVAPERGRVDYDRSGTGYLPRTLCLTAIAGLCGLPQISAPFATADGLPAGVSFLGAADTESALIALAAALDPDRT